MFNWQSYRIRCLVRELEQRQEGNVGVLLLIRISSYHALTLAIATESALAIVHMYAHLSLLRIRIKIQDPGSRIFVWTTRTLYFLHTKWEWEVLRKTKWGRWQVMSVRLPAENFVVTESESYMDYEGNNRINVIQPTWASLPSCFLDSKYCPFNHIPWNLIWIEWDEINFKLFPKYSTD